jgi:hypothetical protein
VSSTRSGGSRCSASSRAGIGTAGSATASGST